MKASLRSGDTVTIARKLARTRSTRSHSNDYVMRSNAWLANGEAVRVSITPVPAGTTWSQTGHDISTRFRRLRGTLQPVKRSSGHMNRDRRQRSPQTGHRQVTEKASTGSPINAFSREINPVCEAVLTAVFMRSYRPCTGQSEGSVSIGLRSCHHRP